MQANRRAERAFLRRGGMTADMTVFLLQNNRNEAKSIPTWRRSKIFPLTTASHLDVNALSFKFSKENKRKGTPFGVPGLMCRGHTRKRLLVNQRRYERACKRIADVNVTFCEKGGARMRAYVFLHRKTEQSFPLLRRGSPCWT